MPPIKYSPEVGDTSQQEVFPQSIAIQNFEKIPLQEKRSVLRPFTKRVQITEESANDPSFHKEYGEFVKLSPEEQVQENELLAQDLSAEFAKIREAKVVPPPLVPEKIAPPEIHDQPTPPEISDALQKLLELKIGKTIASAEEDLVAVEPVPPTKIEITKPTLGQEIKKPTSQVSMPQSVISESDVAQQATSTVTQPVEPIVVTSPQPAIEQVPVSTPSSQPVKKDWLDRIIGTV